MDNSSENTDSTASTENMYYYLNGILMNPSIVIIIFVVLIVYFVIFSYLGDSTNEASISSIDQINENNGSSKALGITVIGLFVLLAFINGVQYFFGLDVVAKLKNVFSGKPEIDITVDQTNVTSPSVIPELKTRPQVFNIPGNNYVYSDAKALCTAYGSRLATYKELEQTYNEGGEWCNYGWSDGQMALYPTQQSTFDGLQKKPGHENDCGRPGVNGGYMSNPAMKFGVNCFGYKPQITSDEEELMATTTPYPKTKKDLAMEQRVVYWQDKLKEILVSPFNYNNWSKL
jgi:hypothetical protein